MKTNRFMQKFALALLISAFLAKGAQAQPSYVGPAPTTVVEDNWHRQLSYQARLKEMLTWRDDAAKKGGEKTVDMAAMAVKLARHEDAALCSRRVIEMMKTPGSGPFAMFPMTCVAFLGRDQLSPQARQAIRDVWRTTLQVRGDTENHWAMYYSTLYLMSEMYPNDPASSWYTGKSSRENMAEAKAYLISWMDIATRIGQGEFNPTHYIGEYAIPLLFLSNWAQDPVVRQRAHMMLDWIFADFAENTLNGTYIGAHARTDDIGVVEKWNSLSSCFSWLFFGNCPPPASYGSWPIYFAAADNDGQYVLPEVIYRIGVDRTGDYLQRDLKRSRRRWRDSPVLMAPIYKTTYVRKDYAVGSYQGGLADPIQTHVWDVTWAVPDPRGKHNTMFSMNPISSPYDMQMYFAEFPDAVISAATNAHKPTYDSPDKFLGCSAFEQVFQDLDTVVALYNIPPGTRFPHVNGFFSRDLVGMREDPSGWIFAQGGRTYLAYRPLAPYEWRPVQGGDKRLYSPHLKNGTILQAAAAAEFKSFEAFQQAILALPLEVTLEPTPSVKMRTLRGNEIVCAYGQTPVLNGTPVDYSSWKLFEGPYLQAEKYSRRLVIKHGKLERILDFNNLSSTDLILP